MHHAVFLQLGQRHFHHPHRTGDDPRARGNDRVGLLALQHRLGDFRGVGEVADAGVDHLYTGIGQAFGKFITQMLRDFRGMTAQRNLAILVLVVRVAGGHRAQCGFRLDVHETFVVIHVVNRLGTVLHLPDNHGGNFNRAAVELVDLELA